MSWPGYAPSSQRRGEELNWSDSFTIPVSLLIAHFVGDGLLQSDWMALNKSKSLKALSLHVLIYSLCFSIWGPRFWAITFVTHWATDFITSRLTSMLWFIKLRPFMSVLPDATWWDYVANVANGKRHWFFVVILFDQLIHFVTLAATFKLLTP